MKVRITTDLSDSDRLMIGAITHGTLGVIATHEECTEYLIEILQDALEPPRRGWQKVNDEIVSSLKISE